MSKILCDQGYIILKQNLTEEQIKLLKKDLNVKPFIHGKRGNFVKKFKIYKENDIKFCIPKFYGINHFGIPDINDISNGNDINLSFEGSLRDYQSKLINDNFEKIRDQLGGTISLPPGRGKTVIALNLICKLGKKTLVIVHKSFLLKQWEDRINQFIPNANVGIIQGKIIDIQDKDIVIGMLQSISLKDDYSDDLFDEFGTIIIDEAHHISAEKFSQALQKISAPYMIGLSATPFRDDKLEKVLSYYIGDIIYYEKPKENQNILVNIYKYNTEHERFRIVINKYTQEAQIATMITNLTLVEDRNDFIISLIISCRTDSNRKILVLSERLEHLNNLKSQIDLLDIGSTGLYVGGMKQKKLDISAEANIIFSTYSMSSEGLDIGTLNTVLLATPRRKVEQSTGRILRKNNYIIQPLIIDIVDKIKTFTNQSYTRNSYYKKITNNIITFTYENGIISVKNTIKKNPPNEPLFYD